MKKNIKIIKTASIISIIILLLVILIISLNCTYKVSYISKNKPGYKINSRLNIISKKLEVTSEYYCSSKNCKTKKYKYSVVLTKEEYKKFKIIKDKENKSVITNILKDLAMNDEIIEVSGKKVTCREYANDWLDIIIENKYKK